MTIKNIHFDNQYDIHMGYVNYERIWLQAQVGFAIYLALIVCFISYEKWACSLSACF